MATYKEIQQNYRKIKCDDLIEISEKEIKFKIGRVEQEDLERFLKTYKKYLTK